MQKRGKPHNDWIESVFGWMEGLQAGLLYALVWYYEDMHWEEEARRYVVSLCYGPGPS